ncbi:Hypothetical predicted protein [Octopus vulgaris]|uniref:Uncharacterized protein n=1 Tax=Octopus vulgaris TaxID=6645 RepID=A0AA36AH78_OCTVU|nr:Hypothetical predicted protein [Octopus vulgaris]
MKLEKMIATTYRMLIFGFVIVVLDFIVITKAILATKSHSTTPRRITGIIKKHICNPYHEQCSMVIVLL